MEVLDEIESQLYKYTEVYGELNPYTKCKKQIVFQMPEK